jgi:hypothetical protein
MNWGLKIACLYGGFVLVIGGLVYGSMRQQFDLVTDDYYKQEIAYQQVLDAGKNQSRLSAPVKLTQTGTQLQLEFPQDFAGKHLSGSVQFYSPVAASRDQRVEFNTDQLLQELAVDGLQKGTYQVKLQWTADGEPYYQTLDYSRP